MPTKQPVGAQVLYPDLSYKLMDALFEVHRQLGPGFTEYIYERAVMHELERRQIPYEHQKVIQVCYKDQVVGTYRLDLVIDQKIILELKAVTEMSTVFEQQLLSYLKATHLRLGILANFGTDKLEHQRKVN